LRRGDFCALAPSLKQIV
jgi:hypothetical protein